MTNWKEIHSDFTEELQKDWEEKGFSYEECFEWINKGMRPTDSELCLDLKIRKDKQKEIHIRTIEQKYNILSQKTPHQTHPNAIYYRRSINTKQINQLLQQSSQSLNLNQNWLDSTELELKLSTEEIFDWTNIHPSFTSKLIKNWQTNNFNHYQTQELINIGLQPLDFNFAVWLRDNKQLTPEQVNNLEQLKEEFFKWLQEQKLQVNIEELPK